MTPRPSYSWAWTLIFLLGTWCIRRRQAWRFSCWETQRSFHGCWVGTSSTRTWRCFRSQQGTFVTPWHARGCHVSCKSEESASCRDQVCLPLGQRADWNLWNAGREGERHDDQIGGPALGSWHLLARRKIAWIERIEKIERVASPIVSLWINAPKLQYDVDWSWCVGHCSKMALHG